MAGIIRKMQSIIGLEDKVAAYIVIFCLGWLASAAFLPPFLSGTAGLFLVVFSAVRWKLAGGFFSAVWASLVMLTGFLSPQDLSVTGLLTGMSAYFVIGIGLGRALDFAQEKELLLEQKTEEQNILLDNMETQIWYLLDMETYGQVNNAFADFFDVNKEDMYGKKIYDLLDEKEVQACIASNKEVFSKKQKIYSEEWRMDGTGKYRHFYIRKIPKLDENNNVEYVICSAEDISGSKKVQEELEDSRKQYLQAYNLLEGILESSQEVVIFALDTEYRYLAFNSSHRQTMKQIWGVDIKIGSCMLDHIKDPVDGEKARRNFDRALNGESFTVVEQYGDAEMDRRWYQNVYSPLYDQSSGVMGLTLFLTDVTKQKELEESLTESERRFSLAQSFSKTGVWEYDIVKSSLYWSEECERVFGLAKGEFEGTFHDFLKRVHPEDVEYVKEMNKPITEKEGSLPLEYEHRIIRKDGEIRWVRESAGVLKDDTGNPVRLIGFVMDITHSKKTEEQLKQVSREYETVFHGTQDAMFLVEVLGENTFRYIRNNRSHEEATGISLHKIRGKTPQELVGAELGNKIAANYARCLREEGPISYEETLDLPRGKRTWNTTLTPVFDRQNQVAYIVASCHDITERKQSEKIMQARLNVMTYAYDNSLEAVLQKTLDEVCDIVDSPIGFYHFVSSDQKSLTLKAWSTNTINHFCEMGDKRGMHYDIDKAGVWVDCIRKCRPIIHNDYASVPGRKGIPEGHAQIVRELVVPIMRQDRIVAVLGVGNKKVDYTESDVQVVSFLADVAWEVAEQKQAEQKIHYMTFHDQLTGLYNRTYLEEEISRLDTERQLPMSIIMADLNGLKLVNDTYGHLVGDEMIQCAASILKESCRKEDIIARRGGDEFIVFLPQTTEDEARIIKERIEEKSREVYMGEIPVSMSLGVAMRESTEKKLPTALKEAEDLMYKDKIAKSRNIRSALLKAMLTTLQEKSFETDEHTRIMQNLAMKVGEQLELPDSEKSRLKLLIYLHDIGKIKISEEILTKKGPLTTEEWEIMKKHPETGYRIARATEDFVHVAEDILAHHENWDGTGYPQGLKGREIPLLARITSIVDAYEAMTSGRAYKKPLSSYEAAAKIKRSAGTKFDPDLVDIFLSVLEI